jgi:L-asparaginase II
VLVEIRRGGLVESRHRGHIVQVDAKGRVERGVGDPDYVTSLRSGVKPFALLALLEAGGADAFQLTGPELAVMASSHHGEDAHVRTLQAVLRRAGLSQSLLGNGIESAPIDKLTASRLARDGEAPGPIRQMCSGFHVASLLLARHSGWTLADYWHPEHPTQAAVRASVGRVFGVKPTDLHATTDNCGVQTYAFPIAAIAKAFALLADPEQAADASLSTLVPHLTRVRDAMLGSPEMVGGTRGSSDTLLMRSKPGMIVAKGGAEGLRGIGLLPGARGKGSAAAGVAIKIEDGDYASRAKRSASVEALDQLGVLDAPALGRLGEELRPRSLDPRGVEIATGVAVFQLAPLSELG